MKYRFEKGTVDNMANGNSVSDEIGEQRKKAMEGAGFKERLSYFFYYYKVHVLLTVVIGAVVISTIVSLATKKDIVLQVVYINGFPVENTETFMADFATTIPINPEKEEVLLDDSFYIAAENRSTFDEQNQEKLFMMSAAGTVDVCVSDEAFFMELVKQGYLLDLSTVLTDEQMEQYQDRLFYYDSDENKTEGKEAVGIKITDAPKIMATNSFPNTDCYYSIVVNSKHTDNALAFLEYLETE